MTIFTYLALCSTVLLVGMPVASGAESLKDAEVWYAPLLRSYFSEKIPIHGVKYSPSEIPCLPKDITKFDVDASRASALGVEAFSVRGSVRLGEVPAPFEVVDGAQGRRYMLHLQAYLFAPNGEVVWSQQGFPSGKAWVESSGDFARFELIDSYSGPLHDHKALVLAAGDPIFSDSSESRVILGIEEIKLP